MRRYLHAIIISTAYYPLFLSTPGWMEFLTLANPFTYALRHTLEIFPALLYLCRPFLYRYYSLLFNFPLFLFLAFKYETNLRRWIDDQASRVEWVEFAFDGGLLFLIGSMHGRTKVPWLADICSNSRMTQA